jgi:hypothetical protein
MWLMVTMAATMMTMMMSNDGNNNVDMKAATSGNDDDEHRLRVWFDYGACRIAGLYHLPGAWGGGGCTIDGCFLSFSITFDNACRQNCIFFADISFIFMQCN